MDIEIASYDSLDDRILVVRAGDEVDGAFVRTERFSVLVDTLSTPEMCARALELLAEHVEGRPLIVVNSHMDWDHFWGNAAVDAGTPIVAHSSAMKRLGDGGIEKELAEKQSEEARFRNVEILSPTMTFSGPSMCLHGGDLTLELLHTPGHTPDHVAVWIPELRVCLAVDAVEDPIPAVWSKSPKDLQDLYASLKTIRDLKPLHTIVAHGQTSDPEITGRNIAYFERVHASVAGASAAQLAAEALDEQPGFRLEDFISLGADMPPETMAFYRGFHKSNLRAVIAARLEGIGLV